ncbi:hypothetical protein Q4E40_02730 [Pontibacter sp. BT731]|uniref:hypothetical protein n=1 Tax=Pontibacter coccineus TaxID=3063328 RepID=UPI0026E3FCB2|nr:hypothetical protein [Pontibacter sp. BT731]MDO6389028.1 hypothetical protein [Pontibacter sp. BT731]
MNWIRITPETEFNYSDSYLFLYPKGDGKYAVGWKHNESANGKQWIMLGDSEWFGDDAVEATVFTHYCVITPPKN